MIFSLRFARFAVSRETANRDDSFIAAFSLPHYAARLTRPKSAAIIPHIGCRFSIASLTQEDLPMSIATQTKSRAVKPPKVKEQPLLCGGKWLDSVSGKTFSSMYPATG